MVDSVSIFTIQSFWLLAKFLNAITDPLTVLFVLIFIFEIELLVSEANTNDDGYNREQPSSTLIKSEAITCNEPENPLSIVTSGAIIRISFNTLSFEIKRLFFEIITMFPESDFF